MLPRSLLLGSCITSLLNSLNVRMDASLPLPFPLHQKWARVEYTSPSPFVDFPQFPCRTSLHVIQAAVSLLVQLCHLKDFPFRLRDSDWVSWCGRFYKRMIVMSVSQMTLFLISCWYCHEKEQQLLKNYILH